MNNKVNNDSLSYSTYNYKKQQMRTTKGELAAYFVKRTVTVIVVIGCSILFPFTGVAVGVKSFYKSRHQGIDLFTRLRGSLATAVFPLVIIGPVLFYKLSKNNTIKGMSMLADVSCGPKTIKDYCVVSIPFLSSFVVSVNLFYPYCSTELHYLYNCGSLFFDRVNGLFTSLDKKLKSL